MPRHRDLRLCAFLQNTPPPKLNSKRSGEPVLVVAEEAIFAGVIVCGLQLLSVGGSKEGPHFIRPPATKRGTSGNTGGQKSITGLAGGLVGLLKSASEMVRNENPSEHASLSEGCFPEFDLPYVISTTYRMSPIISWDISRYIMGCLTLLTFKRFVIAHAQVLSSAPSRPFQEPVKTLDGHTEGAIRRDMEFDASIKQHRLFGVMSNPSKTCYLITGFYGPSWNLQNCNACAEG